MNEAFPAESSTRILGIPLLNQTEIDNLVTENFGIVPAHIVHFETYEDWVSRTSNSTWGLGFFLNGKMFDPYKELQCMQRYVILYPEEYEHLVEKVNELESGKPPESIDKEIWQAYEKIASLVDVNDAFLERNDKGEINPSSLLI